MDYIYHRFRDGKEINENDWYELLKIDVEEESRDHEWDLKTATYTDVFNGRDVNLNGHLYQIKLEEVYDTACELLEDLVDSGEYDIILDAVQYLSEDELRMIFSKLKRVTMNNGKISFLEE